MSILPADEVNNANDSIDGTIDLTTIDSEEEEELDAASVEAREYFYSLLLNKYFQVNIKR